MIKSTMVKKILQIGDPILEKKSEKINIEEIKSPEIQTLTSDLIDTAKSEGDKSAGLSAPQLGSNKRIFVVRRFDLEKNPSKTNLKNVIWEVLINPEILSLGSETSTYWEGCLSIGFGDNQLYGPVTRPRELKVQYLDSYGTEKKLELIEFMSHAIQHEVDHLEGILFLSHINNPENIWTSKALDEYFAKHDEYPEVK